MWELLALLVALFTILFSILYGESRYFSILLAAFAARLVFIPIFTSVMQADVLDYLPYFVRFSELVTEHGVVRAAIEFFGVHVNFYTLLYPGYIYTLLGQDGLIVIRMMNAGLALLILPVLNGINKVVFGKRLKRWQAALVLFWPAYAFLSVELGRTVPSVLLVCFSVYAFLKLINDISLANSFVLLGASVGVAAIRVFYSVYVFGLFSLIYVYKTSRSDRKALHVGVVGVISGLSVLVVKQLVPYQISIRRINDLASSMAHGGSSYLTTTYPESFIDLIWYIPLQGVYYQFSPFIWDLFRISDPLSLVAFLQSILVLSALVLVALNRDSDLVNWQFYLVLIGALAVPFVLGVGVKNAGAAVRWRIPTDILIVSLASTIVDYEYLTDG